MCVFDTHALKTGPLSEGFDMFCSRVIRGRGYATPLEGVDGGGEGGRVEGSQPRAHVAAWRSN